MFPDHQIFLRHVSIRKIHKPRHVNSLLNTTMKNDNQNDMKNPFKLKQNQWQQHTFLLRQRCIPNRDLNHSIMSITSHSLVFHPNSKKYNTNPITNCSHSSHHIHFNQTISRRRRSYRRYSSKSIKGTIHDKMSKSKDRSDRVPSFINSNWGISY